MDPRVLPLFWRSLGVSARALWRTTRQLFHEAMGTIFAIFAMYGILVAWRQWKAHPIIWLTVFAVAYTIVMALFSVAAFRRARRIGQLESGK